MHQEHLTIFTISHMPIASLSLMHAVETLIVVIIFRCCHFPTKRLHAVKTLISNGRHFLLLWISNWPSSGVCEVYNIPSSGVKGTSSVLCSSGNLCSISQNMYYKAPVAAQHWNTNKVVCTWKDDWPPWRTSTYERPFTQEGNYLVYAVTVIVNDFWDTHCNIFWNANFVVRMYGDY